MLALSSQMLELAKQQNWESLAQAQEQVPSQLYAAYLVLGTESLGPGQAAPERPTPLEEPRFCEGSGHELDAKGQAVAVHTGRQADRRIAPGIGQHDAG